MSTAELYEEFEQMVRGEIMTMSRDEFRQRCDADDQIIYLYIAREIAKKNRCVLNISEEEFEFVCPPPL